MRILYTWAMLGRYASMLEIPWCTHWKICVSWNRSVTVLTHWHVSRVGINQGWNNMQWPEYPPVFFITWLLSQIHSSYNCGKVERKYVHFSEFLGCLLLSWFASISCSSGCLNIVMTIYILNLLFPFLKYGLSLAENMKYFCQSDWVCRHLAFINSMLCLF